jgi:hypothetical protein
VTTWRTVCPASGPFVTSAWLPSTSLTSHVSATAQSGSPDFPSRRAIAEPPNTSGLAVKVRRNGYQSMTRAPLTGLGSG